MRRILKYFIDPKTATLHYTGNDAEELACLIIRYATKLNMAEIREIIDLSKKHA